VFSNGKTRRSDWAFHAMVAAAVRSMGTERILVDGGRSSVCYMAPTHLSPTPCAFHCSSQSTSSTAQAKPAHPTRTHACLRACQPASQPASSQDTRACAPKRTLQPMSAPSRTATALCAHMHNLLPYTTAPWLSLPVRAVQPVPVAMTRHTHQHVPRVADMHVSLSTNQAGKSAGFALAVCPASTLPAARKESLHNHSHEHSSKRCRPLIAHHKPVASTHPSWSIHQDTRNQGDKLQSQKCNIGPLIRSRPSRKRWELCNTPSVPGATVVGLPDDQFICTTAHVQSAQHAEKVWCMQHVPAVVLNAHTATPQLQNPTTQLQPHCPVSCGAETPIT
jgi:hypothetical protein